MRGRAELNRRVSEATTRQAIYNKLSLADKISKAEAAPGESSKQLRRLKMQK